MASLQKAGEDYFDRERAETIAAVRMMGGGRISDFMNPDFTPKSRAQVVAEVLIEIRAARIEKQAEIAAQQAYAGAWQRGTAKASAQPPNPLPGPPVSPKHALARKRKHFLHHVIAGCLGTPGWQVEPGTVWTKMVAKARAQEDGLLGVTDKGIQYLDANDSPKEYSRKQLAAYLKGSNIKEKPPSKAV